MFKLEQARKEAEVIATHYVEGDNYTAERIANKPILCGLVTEVISRKHPQKLSRFLRELVNYSNDNIFIIWSSDDIKERRPDLTDEQCYKVLKSLEKDHESCYGITWETIDSTADFLFKEPANISELRLNYSG